MKLGLRSILIVAAVLLFVIAVFSDVHWPDFIALGLAVFAASYVVDDFGLADRTFGSTEPRP